MGLVGYGRFGRMHIKAFSQIPDAVLIAVCVRSDKNFQEATDELGGIPVFRNYSEFLRSSDADCIDVVTPNYTHTEIAVGALSAGKNVYLEKPIATTLEEATRIAEAQRSSKRILQVGFENRYSRFWKSVKAIVDGGDIGPLRFGKIDSWRFPLRGGSQAWKYDKQKVGHQLLEEAIHYVDLANWLFNTKPLKVWGFIDSKESLARADLKSAFFTIEFEKDKRFLITDTLQGFGADLSLIISGESGSLNGAVRSESDDSPEVESYLKLRDRNDKTSTTIIQPSGQLSDLTASLADFVLAVKNGEKPRVTVEDGFTSLSVCLAALQSMRSGKIEAVRLLES